MATSCSAGQILVPDPANPGQYICITLPRNDPACAPPLVPAVSGNTITCVAPPTCKVFFEYVKTDPTVVSTPSLEMQPGCDAAGLELATAVLLAKLLGAR